MRKVSLLIILLVFSSLVLNGCFVFVPYPTGDEKVNLPTATASPNDSPTPEEKEVSTSTPIQPTSTAEITPTQVEEIVDTSPNTVTPLPTETPTPTMTPSAQTPVPGIEMHNIDERGGLNLIQESGAHWVRRNALFWSLVEPSKGERRWESISSLEKEMVNASSAGLETVMVVRRTPYWAHKVPGYYCGAVAEEALQAFGDFMYDLVSRYSVPPYNVMYWEIGNEPDVAPRQVTRDHLFGCWGDENEPYFGGEYYAEMLKVVYPRLKAANTDAQLLIGGLLLDCDPRNPPEIPEGSGKIKDCTSSLFLEGILKNDGGDYFDGVSFHAYDYYWGAEGLYKNVNWNSSSDETGPVLIPKVDYLRSVLNENNHPEKYLINSEVGIVCGRDGREWICYSDEFQKTKAYYVVQSNTAALAEGLRANIWYSIYGWRASGLARTSQVGYPALEAFEVFTHLLDGAVFVRKLPETQGLIGYEFFQNGKTIWIIWASDREDHVVQLPDTPINVQTVFGIDIPPDTSVVVGTAPIYIIFE